MGAVWPVSLACPARLCLAALLMLAAMPLPAGAQGADARPAAKVVQPLIFVPGLLGSRLCRPDAADPKKTEVVWGTLAALRSFPTIRLSHQAGADDPIKPCGVVREVVYLGLFRQEVYAPLVRHLEHIGYAEGRNLFIFDYDWRRSIFDNAAALDRFVQEKVPEGRFDILAHSMGALVARIYVSEAQSGRRAARLFSAGTPFHGSVKVFQTVEKGWGALNLAMGGLAGFRRTMLSFPSVYELMPRYTGCCAGEGAAAFDPAQREMWVNLHWDGVEPKSMPDLARVFERVRRLQRTIATPLPAGTEDVLLVGVDQRTPQRASFDGAGRLTALSVKTTWAGDGTVIRDSAVLDRVPLHPTSFAEHQRILEDPQIQDFLRVALTEGVTQALQSVQVRPRGRMRGVDGSLTELVGVAIEPDEPIYRTGDICKVHVHLRLGDKTRIDPAAIRLTRRMPDGRDVAISLKPDPAASDPSNPFEQSFVGQFEAGVKPGHAMLKAMLDIEGGKPRMVEQPVAVIAR